MDARVVDKMATDVQAVRADDSVVSAVSLFSRLGYGRFPVLDREGRLVGILTKGDVVRGLLREVEVEWHAEEIRRYRASHLFEDIESDQTALILRYRVKARDFAQGGVRQVQSTRALARLGAQPALARRVAIATYEAEMNLVIHSQGGEITAEVRPGHMKVIVPEDRDWFTGLDQALQPGFSTASAWVRELGFGAGMGLSNIKACADEMKLESTVGVGTRLECYFELRGKGDQE